MCIFLIDILDLKYFGSMVKDFMLIKKNFLNFKI